MALPIPVKTVVGLQVAADKISRELRAAPRHRTLSATGLIIRMLLLGSPTLVATCRLSLAWSLSAGSGLLETTEKPEHTESVETVSVAAGKSRNMPSAGAAGAQRQRLNWFDNGEPQK